MEYLLNLTELTKLITVIFFAENKEELLLFSFFPQKMPVFLSRLQQKRDICTAFPAAASAA